MTAETTLATPVRRRTGSPLAGYVDRFATVSTTTGGRVRIAEQPMLAQLTLRADPSTRLHDVLGGALPVPGVAIGDTSPRTLGIGPDEWLIVGAPGSQQSITEALRAGLAGRGAVVDVSGQRTTIALTGAKSRDLLAKGCSIDMHPRVFHGTRCAQTQLARAQVIIVGQPERHDSFWVLARSSFARYVADWMLDAACEYRRACEAGAR
ncbi:MAG: sarcosine oxidase subunit gamma [Sciscionella sp.]